MSQFDAAAVNQFNAYAYSDNYSILNSVECVGCEHNETEALMLATWLSNYHGRRYEVRRNTPDQVRAAKQWRPQPMRHGSRDKAFAEMGLGTKNEVRPSKRRLK